MLRLEPKQQQAAQRALSTAYILWAALTASPILMLVVVRIALPERNAPAGDGVLSLLTPLLALESGAMVAVSLWVRFKLQARITAAAGTTFELALQRWVTLVILAGAVAESIAVNGIILYVMGVDLKIAIAFAGASCCLLFFEKPRSNEIQALADRLRQEPPKSFGP